MQASNRERKASVKTIYGKKLQLLKNQSIKQLSINLNLLKVLVILICYQVCGARWEKIQLSELTIVIDSVQIVESYKKLGRVQWSTIQFNIVPIQSNLRQNNPIQFDTVRSISIWSNNKHTNTTNYDTILSHAMQYNTPIEYQTGI